MTGDPSVFHTLENVFLETPPWTRIEGYGVMGERYDTDVLDPALAGLPGAFREALETLRTKIDVLGCRHCDAPVGFVLRENRGDTGPDEIVEWVPTGLTRHVTPNPSPAADPDPVLFECEACAPLFVLPGVD